MILRSPGNTRIRHQNPSIRIFWCLRVPTNWPSILGGPNSWIWGRVRSCRLNIIIIFLLSVLTSCVKALGLISRNSTNGQQGFGFKTALTPCVKRPLPSCEKNTYKKNIILTLAQIMNNANMSSKNIMDNVSNFKMMLIDFLVNSTRITQ